MVKPVKDDGEIKRIERSSIRERVKWKKKSSEALESK